MAPKGPEGDLTTNIAGDLAAAEAEYSQMWAQDVEAMYGYHGSSAVNVTAELVAVDDYTTQACPSSAKPLRAVGTLTQNKGDTSP